MGVFGDQYDPTKKKKKSNLGAAASAHVYSVLDSSGTRLKEEEKKNTALS